MKLVTMSEFLKQLPPKKCSECKEKIEEQHECYGNICPECLSN